MGAAAWRACSYTATPPPPPPRPRLPPPPLCCISRLRRGCRSGRGHRAGISNHLYGRRRRRRRCGSGNAWITVEGLRGSAQLKWSMRPRVMRWSTWRAMPLAWMLMRVNVVAWLMCSRRFARSRWGGAVLRGAVCWSARIGAIVRRAEMFSCVRVVGGLWWVFHTDANRRQAGN